MSKLVRKGKLSNGLWKWLNFKNKFIVLKKVKRSKHGKKTKGKQTN